MMWTDEHIALLGTDIDKNVGKIINRSINSISSKRIRLKIPAFSTESRVLRWAECENIDQIQFYNKLCDYYNRCHKKRLTHEMLSQFSHWELSLINNWFTPGSSQEPLPFPIRHHLYLSIRWKASKIATDK